MFGFLQRLITNKETTRCSLNIHDRVPVLQADAMLQIALILKNLLVDIVRLVLVQVNDFQAIRQNISRTVSRSIVWPCPYPESCLKADPLRPILPDPKG